jgi:hypothetical protein
MKEINQLTEPQVAYLAGLIDGEGTICMSKCNHATGDRKVRYRVRLTVVATTSLEMLDWLVSEIGAIPTKVGTPKSPKHRQGWRVSLAEKQAEQLLERAMPYLVIKKRQAGLYLRYRSLQKACGNPALRLSKEKMKAMRVIRDCFLQEFRKLNAKGPETVSTNTPDMISEFEIMKIESGLHGNMQRVNGDVAPPTVLQ